MFRMTPLPPATVSALKARIDLACADPGKPLPGVTVVVVANNGEQLFAHAAGYRDCEISEPMSLDTVFWIASCTKLIAGIACMQLVEQGQISLDKAEEVERLCPELRSVRVLQPDGQLVEKRRGITLRMLLSHTGQPFTPFHR
jgi:CubicO group peptidase (beta-lactamase class C family)